MFLTIQTLFDDANIVSAIIRRVNQTRKIQSIGSSILLSAE